MATSLVVDTGVTKKLAVETDATQTDAVVLSDRTVIDKTGTGLWTLPSGVFTRDKTVNLDVRAGGVKLQKTAQTLATYPQPLATMNKAALWFDSGVNLIETDGQVTAWRDVRDTDPATTNYIYALTDNTVTNLCPEVTTFADKTMVSFGGGMDSGRWMNWLNPDGTQARVGGIQHAFIVRGAASASINAWGHMLGQRRGQTPYFQAGNTGIWTYHNRENVGLHNSRTYRDGVEVEPFTTGTGSGLHVDEVQHLGGTLSAQCFCNDRDMWKDENGKNPLFPSSPTSQTGGGKRLGGSYIAEVLLFSEQLSPEERLAVTDWLRAKWLDSTPPQEVAFNVTLASNAVLEVADELPSMTLSGNGTIRKTGEGTQVVRSNFNPRQSAFHIDVEAGLLALGYLQPFICGAGDTVTSTMRHWGPEYAPPTATAGAGNLVKTGNGPLMLDNIPADVERLTVQAGDLVLTAPETGTAGIVSEVDQVVSTIPNGDCETYTRSGSVYTYINNNGENGGWHAIVPGLLDGKAQDSKCFFFDQTMEQPMYWNMVLQEAGHRSSVFVLKNNASAWREFTVPRTGRYQLGFRAAPRGGCAGLQLDVMVGTSEADLVRLGDFATSSSQQLWLPYKFPAIDLEAGVTYQLWLKSRVLNDDRCTQFDDFSLTCLGQAQDGGVYPLPNGDFEQCAADFVVSDTSVADNTNRVTGFTVTQGTITSTDSYENGWPIISTFAACTSGSYLYNIPWSTGGSVMLHLSGAGATLTSVAFTPPAGTWRFRADLCLWDCSSANSTAYDVSVELDVGGTKIDLGTVEETNHALLPHRWPTSFTVDGATPVVVKLTGSLAAGRTAGHALIDNLMFEPAQAENLLVNGGLNGSVSPWKYLITPKPPAVSGSSYQDYDSFYRTYFGEESFEGSGCAKIVNDDCLWQSVNFPRGGLYRFSANLKARSKNGGFGNGLNPLDFYVAKDGVTNWIGRTDSVMVTNFQEYAYLFTLPAGGTYDVGFKGCTVYDGVTPVDRTTLIDAAQVYRVTAAEAPTMPKSLKIDVADAARLHLEFTGTNEVNSLHLGGRSYVGFVSAATCPDLYPQLTGPGTLFIRNKGTVVLFR